MGSGVTLNARTGVLSGIAPQIAFSGEYVVTVCVFEYRNGVQFAESRKELHIRVRDCIPIEARLDPRPVTCDGFTVQFVNDADPLPAGTTYEWQFGDTASGAANTSTQQTPSHTYADTGRYLVKLKVTTGGFCADSTTLLMRVYPGFFPDFNTNPPFCKGLPVTFTDFTTTQYGVPTGWRWDFGETNTLADTARTRNASYIYNTPGNYTVTLVVGNTFGCVDTITRNVTIIEKPPLTLSPKDTTYCALDSVSLRASSSFGAGVYSWLPVTNIIGANTAEPLVFPTVPTKYYVNFNISGCTNTDSVMVRPVNNVTATIAASAPNICQEDTLQLTASSNYSNVKWQWQPAASLSSDTARQVKAFPSANTTYNLRVNWGKCTATASRAITVTPLAVPEAGPNTAICFKQDTARLSASGGVRYTWTPTTGLDNPNSPNPIATPTVTTTYKVAVGVAGCARTKTDSVTVLVRPLPDIQLTNDTLICSIDTLRLQTSNAGSVVWTPNYMINNLLDNRPLVSPDVPTTYYVTMTDGFGCINRDSVKVDVKLFVTIDAGNDTTICLTDSLRLPTISDALSYQWSPGLYMNNINSKNPVVRPAVPSITYRVLGNIGKCQSTDSITIRTVPYPVPDAGVFSTVCYGVSTLLNASGGSQYTWSPARFLSNRTVANPSVINPTSTTLYTVTITDTLGCPKAVTDTVTLNVLPRVIASTGLRDTSIVIGQTLQFNASGGNRYTWSPSTWLNSSFGASPLAAPEENIVYKLLVTVEPFGCSASDSVKIKVFKLPPSFYVPTAFSPNGDGKNDVLRPIALGMRSLNYFRVYNRRGELVFFTNQLNKGWDGFYKGNPQDPQNFVWMAQGLTFDGQLITRKGNAVLVR
jgi:gliding motility-associated-like protein